MYKVTIYYADGSEDTFNSENESNVTGSILVWHVNDYDTVLVPTFLVKKIKETEYE